jgi:hypothetical protein
MLRAISGPAFAQVLASRPDKGEVLDKIYARVADRLAVDPKIHEGQLAAVVLEKT